MTESQIDEKRGERIAPKRGGVAAKRLSSGKGATEPSAVDSDRLVGTFEFQGERSTRGGGLDVLRYRIDLIRRHGDKSLEARLWRIDSEKLVILEGTFAIVGSATPDELAASALRLLNARTAASRQP